MWEYGDPYRRIAALELLAVTFGVILLLPAQPSHTLHTSEFSVGTDNQGNEGLLCKWLTTKLPLALVSMELSLQLARRNRTIDLRWRRRDDNAEADALTNEDFTLFDPRLRVPADGVMPSLVCLPSLSAELPAFRAQQRRHKSAFLDYALEPMPQRRVPMRESDPW